MELFQNAEGIPNPPAALASLAECSAIDPASLTRFNVNRGAIVRFTSEGIQVGMYYEDPGVYYDAHGRVIGAALAKSAGFDTDRLNVAHQKKVAREIAMTQIDSQFAEQSTREVVDTAGPYDVVHLGAERYNIEFADDHTVVNLRGPISLELARSTLAALVPEEPVVEVKPEVKGK